MSVLLHDFALTIDHLQEPEADYARHCITIMSLLVQRV
jgi:hypothetical protein